jgi:hypothetical protein
MSDNQLSQVMRRFSSGGVIMKLYVPGFVLLSITAIVASAPAQAQNGSLTRSFVSSSGVDTNPCTVTQPCATFAHAYTAVGASGIVAALDPGKYGPLNIIGAVTIDGNGWAAITAPANNNGITINAGLNDKITLKGLAIDGVGAANDGILFNTGGGLNVFDCTIKNMLDNGIFVSVLNPMSLLVSNTFISNINSAAASSGIYLFNGATSTNGYLIATIDRVMISDSSVGISLYADGNGVEAMVSDSEIVTTLNASTSTIAFVAQGIGYDVFLTARNVRLSGTGQDFYLKGNTLVLLSQVVEGAFYLYPGQGGNNNDILCDGTNHVQIPCSGTWSAQ